MNEMQTEVLAIRAQLQGAMARCDRLLAGHPALVGTPAHFQALYRFTPGGPLSEEGVREIRRRFAVGETNSVIAREMGITVQGVAKRRADFDAVSGGRRRPGALKGKIQMAPDFDDLPQAELEAMEATLSEAAA